MQERLTNSNHDNGSGPLSIPLAYAPRIAPWLWRLHRSSSLARVNRIGSRELCDDRVTATIGSGSEIAEKVRQAAGIVPIRHTREYVLGVRPACNGKNSWERKELSSGHQSRHRVETGFLRNISFHQRDPPPQGIRRLISDATLGGARLLQTVPISIRRTCSRGLKFQLQGKLKNPRTKGRGDSTKAARADPGVGCSEVDIVKDVKELCAELYRRMFRDFHRP